MRRRDHLQPGDRVTIRAWPYKGQTGFLLRRTRLVNLKPAWVVNLISGAGLFGRARIGDRALDLVDHSSE
jgi:hypothetical protein